MLSRNIADAKLANIQALRGFAALNVVLFHIIGAASVYKPSVVYLAPLKGWGASGVDLFFVISGFVMVYTQHHRPKSASQFFINRLLRISPLYWVLTACVLILSALVPAIFRGGGMQVEHALPSFLFFSGLLGESPIIFVGWTLELEMLFYIIFALSILIRYKAAAIGFCVAALSLVAIVGSPLPLEFLFGMGCAAIFISYPDRAGLGLPLFAVGVLLLMSTIFVTDPVEQRVILWGLPSALIVLGAVYLPEVRWRPAAYLGAASYSIYLTQVFVISGFYKVATLHQSRIHGDAAALLCLASGAVIGGLVYEAIERPLARLQSSRRRQFPASPDPALLSVNRKD